MLFKWSHSADWALKRCLRKYWFQNIHASPKARWGTIRREAYILANVQSAHQWVGNVIHKVVSEYFVDHIKFDHSLPDKHVVREVAVDIARRQLQFSQQRRYREPGMTKTKGGDEYAILWENEFENNPYSLTATEAINRIDRSIDHLFSLNWLIKELLESTWIETEITFSWKPKGFNITGRVDLAFLTPDGSTLRVIDWKVDYSGRFQHMDQLKLYAYLIGKNTTFQNSNYQQRSLPTYVKAALLRPAALNLVDGNYSELDWTDNTSKAVQNRIFGAMRQLNALADGRDPKNITGEELSVTKNPNNCKFCAFLKPCQNL